MKTFSEGAILTAQDLNNELNPNTAPNVPFGVATGDVLVAITASVTGDANISFPAGRFTRAPALVATIVDSWKRYWIRANASSATAGVISLYAPAGTTVTETVRVRWMAVQMQSGSAFG